MLLPKSQNARSCHISTLNLLCNSLLVFYQVITLSKQCLHKEWNTFYQVLFIISSLGVTAIAGTVVTEISVWLDHAGATYCDIANYVCSEWQCISRFPPSKITFKQSATFAQNRHDNAWHHAHLRAIGLLYQYALLGCLAQAVPNVVVLSGCVPQKWHVMKLCLTVLRPFYPLLTSITHKLLLFSSHFFI